MPSVQYDSEARRLVKAIKDMGYTPVQIASALGVKTTAINTIFKGDTPGFKLLPRLRTMAQGIPGLKMPEIPPNSGPKPNPAHFRPKAQQVAAGAVQAPVQAPIGILDEPSTSDDDDLELVTNLPASARVEAPDAPDTSEERPQGFAAFAAGFKDMFTAGATAEMSGPPSRRRSAQAEDDTNVIEQMTPVLCLLIVVGSQLLTPDPYKPLAPRQDETTAIVAPLMSIVGRELEVQKRLSENGKALIVSFINTAMYANRAFEDWQVIRKQEALARYDRLERERAARGDHAATLAGVNGLFGANIGNVPGSVQAANTGAEVNPQHGSVNGKQLARHNGRAPNDPIADLLEADAIGRRQFGLG